MCELRTDHAHASLKSRLTAIRALVDHDAHHDHPHDPSPVGMIELDDAELGLATGGLMVACGCTAGCSHHCGSAF